MLNDVVCWQRKGRGMVLTQSPMIFRTCPPAATISRVQRSMKVVHICHTCDGGKPVIRNLARDANFRTYEKSGCAQIEMVNEKWKLRNQDAIPKSGPLLWPDGLGWGFPFGTFCHTCGNSLTSLTLRRNMSNPPREVVT